jgi:SAM-dependent methyltransferase
MQWSPTRACVRSLDRCAFGGRQPGTHTGSRSPQVLPHIALRSADVEHLPYSDQSVRVVFAAQAFHWFAHRRALTELHRVLQPGGHVVLVWNNRDESFDWIAKIEALLDEFFTPDVPRQQTGRWRTALDECPDLFAPPVHHAARNAQTATPAEVADRVLSISVINALPVAEREAVRTRVLDMLATHPQTAAQAVLSVPHVTDSYILKRID